MIIIGVERSGAGFQERWPEFLRKHGVEARMLDLRRDDALQQVRGCAGVMWHANHSPDEQQIVRSLLPVIEGALEIPVFPNWRTRWHFDDKIGQTRLLEAMGLPHPETHVFFDRAEALAWTEKAHYPSVAKLACGAGSSNVRLVRGPDEARAWIRRMFSRTGVFAERSYPRGTSSPARLRDAAVRACLRLAALPSFLFTGRAPLPRQYWQPQRNYALFQEFLPDNPFDTRVTVIGQRAFAYRRMNRPGDFRASGSGNFDVTPDLIDPRCVRAAFGAADKLRAQSIAFDFLFKGPEREPVILEISHGYVSWMVEQCPGHWDHDLAWREGRMWPEEAHVIDFLDRLRTDRSPRS